MNIRKAEHIIRANAVREGAGVTVHRTLGTAGLRALDPFLMLDHFGSDDPDEYIAGFPEHPHRGFITLTYMLDGHMLHRDSMGNQGDLKTGGVQWMKAASGIIHSEMPQQTAGLMRGFQLWINLPAREKMSAPDYQEYAAATLPVHAADGLRVKVLAGQYHEARGPIRDPHTDLHYLDVSLLAGADFAHALPQEHQAFVYVFEGDARLAQTPLAQHSFAALGDGDSVQLQAGANGARFILVSGRPLGEPIVKHGPFVMNTQAEIERALADYRAGTLVQA